MKSRIREVESTQPKIAPLTAQIVGGWHSGSTLLERQTRQIGIENPMRFRAAEQQIRLDEKWGDDLSRGDLLSFERVAGRLSRSLGYA